MWHIPAKPLWPGCVALRCHECPSHPLLRVTQPPWAGVAAAGGCLGLAVLPAGAPCIPGAPAPAVPRHCWDATALSPWGRLGWGMGLSMCGAAQSCGEEPAAHVAV